MKKRLSEWRKNQRGATAVEYTLIAGAVGLAVATVVFAMGGNLTSIFQALDTMLEGALAKT